MSETPKRRWYQFSLQCLLAAIFVAALPLARIAYFQRMLAWHASEEERLVAELAKVEGYNRLAQSESPEVIAAFIRNALEQLAKGHETAKVLCGWPGCSLFSGSGFIPVDKERETELWLSAIHERQLVEAYRAAIFRPWLLVAEPKKLDVTYGQR